MSKKKENIRDRITLLGKINDYLQEVVSKNGGIITKLIVTKDGYEDPRQDWSSFKIDIRLEEIVERNGFAFNLLINEKVLDKIKALFKTLILIKYGTWNRSISKNPSITEEKINAFELQADLTDGW